VQFGGSIGDAAPLTKPEKRLNLELPERKRDQLLGGLIGAARSGPLSCVYWLTACKMAGRNFRIQVDMKDMEPA
jgi:hypothetical protein